MAKAFPQFDGKMFIGQEFDLLNAPPALTRG